MADETTPEPGNQPGTVSAEQRAAEQQVLAGAQDAGVKIAGLSTTTEFERVLAGSKDAPVEIGEKITITARVGEDGTLLPRDGEAPPATSILTIEVIPSVEFDSDGDPHVVWNAYTRQVDVETGTVIATSRSGLSTAELEELQGGRTEAEYGNDPDYKDAVLEKLARSRADAVTRALGQITGSGRMNIGSDPNRPNTPDETTPSRPMTSRSVRASQTRSMTRPTTQMNRSRSDQRHHHKPSARWATRLPIPLTRRPSTPSPTTSRVGPDWPR